jgi:hypothetical protein
VSCRILITFRFSFCFKFYYIIPHRADHSGHAV